MQDKRIRTDSFEDTVEVACAYPAYEAINLRAIYVLDHLTLVCPIFTLMTKLYVAKNGDWPDHITMLRWRELNKNLMRFSGTFWTIIRIRHAQIAQWSVHVPDEVKNYVKEKFHRLHGAKWTTLIPYQVVSVQNGISCIVCYEKDTACTLSPCNHQPFCADCFLDNIYANAGLHTCPFCRSVVVSATVKTVVKDVIFS